MTCAATTATLPDAFVGSNTCRSCHPDAYALWTQSDHYRSMRIATDATVLGDFSGAAVTFHGVETRFPEPGGGSFHVDTSGGSGDRGRFPIRYTFGHWPLQQYLVDAGHGRLQAFGIAWDARPADQGGQRWFHLQPHEDIDPDHPFHWTGHALNWASQCAACHSTNVRKGARDGVTTATYSEVNVACEACHGPGGRHVGLARDGSAGTLPHAGFPNGPTTRVLWRFSPGEPIAAPDRPASARDTDMCGGCHALRTALTDEPMGQGFHDAYRLELARDGLYFLDGQIREGRPDPRRDLRPRLVPAEPDARPRRHLRRLPRPPQRRAARGAQRGLRTLPSARHVRRRRPPSTPTRRARQRMRGLPHARANLHGASTTAATTRSRSRDRTCRQNSACPTPVRVAMGGRRTLGPENGSTTGVFPKRGPLGTRPPPPVAAGPRFGRSVDCSDRRRHARDGQGEPALRVHRLAGAHRARPPRPSLGRSPSAGPSRLPSRGRAASLPRSAGNLPTNAAG